METGPEVNLQERLRRAVTWVLALMLVVSIIGVAYIATNPPETTDPYTEFYILGADGNASDYPTSLSVGETGELTVGIGNHEREPMTYRVVVTRNGSVTQRVRVQAPEGATRERQLTLSVPSEPGRYRVRFLLYRVGIDESEPYRTLQLMVTVGRTQGTETATLTPTRSG